MVGCSMGSYSQLQRMDSGNTQSSLKPDVCELHDSINMKCKQWPGPTLYEAGHQKDEGSVTEKAKADPCIQPGSANEFEKLIASKAGTEISIREAEGRDWTLIRKDNGIRVNARWWDAEWDPTASCSEWTLATYTAA
ncbi:hypothetical protein T4D_6905 [Trichinella pseudospiralis]|uniref:Uncharacterized protein n=1 Tax=Trichinella pseudospiralis TaxID=6337 RepID=A0A0V1FBG5_TRIPS|nr:hypothetical protein T4D_6905 [Trichinella pseudospiralis]